MKNIAITGNFASGKSFVLDCASDLGYKTFSCDSFVKSAYENQDLQQLVVQEIKELDFFDKKKISKLIYQDVYSRKRLESIIHPIVRVAIKEFEQDNINQPIVFVEVPLLFETNFDSNFDYSICVFCSEKLRLHRAKQRKDYSLELFNQINKVQLDVEIKKNKANFIIDSGQDKNFIKQKLEDIINRVL